MHPRRMMTPEESAEGAATPTPNPAGKPKRPALSKILPSERMPFEKQIASLRAFAAVFEANGGKPVTNEEAGVVAKMSPSTIVAVNAWFVDVGILSRAGNGFVVAQEANAFLLAEHGVAPESAPEKLRGLFEKHWSATLLIPRLRASEMDLDAVRKVVGEFCTASPEHLPKIDVLLEYLVWCGVVRKDGNSVRLGNGGRYAQHQPTPAPNPGQLKEPTVGGLGEETYKLVLGKDGRRVTLTAPNSITKAELERIRNWLGFQLTIEDPPN